MFHSPLLTRTQTHAHTLTRYAHPPTQHWSLFLSLCHTVSLSHAHTYTQVQLRQPMKFIKSTRIGNNIQHSCTSQHLAGNLRYFSNTRTPGRLQTRSARRVTQLSSRPETRAASRSQRPSPPPLFIQTPCSLLCSSVNYRKTTVLEREMVVDRCTDKTCKKTSLKRETN